MPEQIRARGRSICNFYLHQELLQEQAFPAIPLFEGASLSTDSNLFSHLRSMGQLLCFALTGNMATFLFFPFHSLLVYPAILPNAATPKVPQCSTAASGEAEWPHRGNGQRPLPWTPLGLQLFGSKPHRQTGRGQIFPSFRCLLESTEILCLNQCWFSCMGALTPVCGKGNRERALLLILLNAEECEHVTEAGNRERSSDF